MAGDTPPVIHIKDSRGRTHRLCRKTIIEVRLYTQRRAFDLGGYVGKVATATSGYIAAVNCGTIESRAECPPDIGQLDSDRIKPNGMIDCYLDFHSFTLN
jgi:hypothetical protein